MDNSPRMNGIPLDNFNLATITDEPIQPEGTEKVALLREAFFCHLAETLEMATGTDDKEVLKLKAEHLYRAYGGEMRFYEKFLIARKYDVEKASLMIKEMLKTRKEVLGNTLVSNVTLTNDFYDMGTDSERDLFKEIDSFWPIDFYGFSASGHVLMTARLKNIQPSIFIDKFKKPEIKRFYFHFMERGSLLTRLSNAKPLRTDDQVKSKRVIEIYDFNGVSMSQLHISGIMVLKDVLGMGQICFPEHIQKSLFINTPWFFSAVWQIISKVLDKNTTNKTVISRHDCKDQIVDLVGADKLKELWERVEKKNVRNQ